MHEKKVLRSKDYSKGVLKHLFQMVCDELSCALLKPFDLLDTDRTVDALVFFREHLLCHDGSVVQND